MRYREGFHRILSLPTPIEGARHRPQGVAMHLLENFSGIQNAFSFKSSDFLIFNFAIVVSQVVCLQHENK